jgi:hypothetical protein
MQLISIGNSPQIVISPPPTVTCEMIAALHKWLVQDLQPLARKYLGAPVIRVETMSSYSCRNAYGRANARLSEHGRANALDIGAFITARSQNALVASDWGPTAREIKAAAASGEGKAAEHAPERAGERPPGGWRPLATRPPEPAPPVALGLQQPGPVAIPGLSVDWLGTSGRAVGLTLGPPSRLGGPKPASTQSAEVPVLPGGKMDFLRSAHRAACKIFGTVLGPEANSAHRNHFHLDMAERKVSVICE